MNTNEIISLSFILFFLIMLAIVAYLVNRQDKGKDNPEWRNSPSPEVDSEIERIIKETEWNKGAKENEKEFYH